jgi:hypothetical protein
MDISLRKSLRGRVARLLLAAALLFGALVWISLDVWTAPAGLVWHLFHGSSVSFEGHRVAVPWDMLVLHLDEKAFMMTRQVPSHAIPILHSPAAVILIQRDARQPTDMSKDYATIARVNEQPPNGYRFDGLRQLSAPKGTIYCWELARLDTPYLSISCWFDKDTLAASFGGSPAYRERFYKVLAAVSGPPPRANP